MAAPGEFAKITPQKITLFPFEPRVTSDILLRHLMAPAGGLTDLPLRVVIRLPVVEYVVDYPVVG